MIVSLSRQLMLVGVVLIPAGRAYSQKDDAEIRNVRAILLYVDTTIRFQADSKKDLREIVNEKDEILRISAAGSPKTILLSGLSPGVSRVAITDSDKQVFTYYVIVRRRLALPVGVETTLELPSKAAIKRVFNENKKVAQVEQVPGEPKRVRVNALMPGESLCILVDEDGKSETFDIVVIKPDRTIAVNSTDTVTAKSLKPIREALVEQEGIVRVRPMAFKGGKEGSITIIAGLKTEVHNWSNDAVSVHGLEVGVARLTLIDSEGNRETLQIGVVPKK